MGKIKYAGFHMLTALGLLESLAPAVSIETELAMEQLKERYEQEIQDLKIQLETKVMMQKTYMPPFLLHKDEYLPTHEARRRIY